MKYSYQKGAFTKKIKQAKGDVNSPTVYFYLHFKNDIVRLYNRLPMFLYMYVYFIYYKLKKVYISL